MAVVVSGLTYDKRPCKMYINGKLMEALQYQMQRVTKKNWDYVGIIAGYPGCLDGETEIKTSKGIEKVKELSNQTIQTISYDFKNNKEGLGHARVFPSGEKEVFEIETEDGRKVQATEKHTFFVLRENKVCEIELKELKVGDELICQEN